jgi:hypothetical protein
LPWLAFERRMRALRFLVFFDMGEQAIGSAGRSTHGQSAPDNGSTARC